MYCRKTKMRNNFREKSLAMPGENVMDVMCQVT